MVTSLSLRAQMPATAPDVVVLFCPTASEDGAPNELPYALLYLERALRDCGLEVVLLDESRQPDYPAVLAEKADRILLAGVSSMTGHPIQGGIAFSKKVREICRAPIVWGGWHPTLLPEQTLQEPYVDYVVVGQGERPLRQLAERLRDGQDVSDIPGLGFKRAGAVLVNPAGPVTNSDAFPPINWSLFDLRQYVYELPPSKRCIGYFASHGCPLNCAYCSVVVSYQRRWFHKSVERIIEDLRILKERADIDGVSFDDDNFFVNIQFCRELAQAMIDAKLNLRWKCSAHARLFTEGLTDDDVALFEQSGCFRIYVGAESGDQQVLDILDKRSKVEHTYRFVEMLKPHGIIPRLSTMVCLPVDPGRDFDLTLAMIGRAKLIDRRLQVSVWFYTPYPRTELLERATRSGFVPPQRLEGWAKHTLREFRAPWAPPGCQSRLDAFLKIYFRMLNPLDYQNVRTPVLRVMAFPANKFFYAVAWLRVKMTCFRFPLEAIAVLRLLGLYSRLRSRSAPAKHETRD